MKVSPWIFGAALIVPVIGAMAGSSISTEPLDTPQDISMLLPDNQINTYAATSPERPLSNHYDLETPEGVVEVADLAFRGRNHEEYRRVEAMEAAYAAEMAAFNADMAPDLETYSASNIAESASADVTQDAALDAAPDPTKDAHSASARAEASTIISGARIIDVQAALGE